jgi:DNA-binding transcriptional ArsR family regulator
VPTLEPLSAPPQHVRIALEPAHSAYNSIFLLNRARDYSGLDEWVWQTAERMGAELLHRNRVVLEGLHYASLPAQSYPSFWAYLSDLAAAEPTKLRDRLVRMLWQHSRREPGPGAPPPPRQPGDLIASLDAYIGFIEHYFSGGAVDLELEAEAYSYMADPPRMHALIVSHMRTMWESYMAAEWERVRGRLAEAVDEVRRLDLRGKAPREAIELVTGQELDGPKWEAVLSASSEIILAPTAHQGPYVMKLADPPVLRIFYGARLPAGVEPTTPSLSRSDLLLRLGALNDDARLQALALLAREDELCAPELMARLDLHQSAVSRHLRQLVAAGYVSERWRDGSKCYRLRRERIDDTLRALERFLS